jgi:S1-C subfamily serine protease
MTEVRRMTIPPLGGSGTVTGQTPYEPYGRDADWNSPLWGQPDTVAAGWSAAATPIVTPTPPAAPQTRPVSRALLASVAVALLIVGSLGVVLVNGALNRHSTTAAAQLPRPSLTAPAVPAPAPSQPALTPPSQGSQGQQGQQGQQGSGSTGQGSQGLTQQQQAAVDSATAGMVDVVSTIGYDGAQGAGTGEVLTSDGIVLTNHHVVAGATTIEVTDIGNGNTYAAKVLGYDRSHDIAVLKLAGASGLATSPLGDSSSVSVGDDVVAVGNALGKGGTPTAVSGSVTDLNQSITATDSADGTSEQLSGLIETDAPIQPGDSGGSLLDSNGKVVGIITAGSVAGSPSQSQSDTQTATAGFAIPIATARSIANEIIDGNSSSTVHIGGTAFLGLQVSGNATSVSTGVLVAGTVAGSAAAQAGIVAGDVVTSIGGHAVTGPDALKSVLDARHPGDKVTVHWTDQSGSDQSASVTLTDGPTG